MNPFLEVVLRLFLGGVVWVVLGVLARTIGFAVRRRQRRLYNLIRTIALRPPSLGLIPTSPAVQALRERERMIQANDPQTERLRCRYALAHLRSRPLRGG